MKNVYDDKKMVLRRWCFTFWVEWSWHRKIIMKLNNKRREGELNVKIVFVLGRLHVINRPNRCSTKWRTIAILRLVRDPQCCRKNWGHLRIHRLINLLTFYGRRTRSGASLAKKVSAFLHRPTMFKYRAREKDNRKVACFCTAIFASEKRFFNIFSTRLATVVSIKHMKKQPREKPLEKRVSHITQSSTLQVFRDRHEHFFRFCHDRFPIALNTERRLTA